jgi:FkbM family methyltransferase
MCVIDAGACDGEFALYASRRVGPAGRVLALEPDPDSFGRLREPFEINGGVPPNVELLQLGLWKHSGELAFSAGNHLTSQLIEAADRPTGSPGSHSVPVQSLPDLASQYGLTRLDFVKMDIEGAEIEAIEGAGSVLSVLRPRFAIASYHRRNARPTAETLARLFREAGYDSATGFPAHLTTYASPATQGANPA